MVQITKKPGTLSYYILYQPQGVPTPRDNFFGTGSMPDDCLKSARQLPGEFLTTALRLTVWPSLLPELSNFLHFKATRSTPCRTIR